MLTFDRTTQDGFWSILAPLRNSDRKVSSCIVDQDGCHCAYTDGSSIRIDKPNIGGRVELKASTIVKQATYSHLNSFCVVSITGHRDISLAFSPCGDTHIDVLPADYPTGRPARFAYLDADSTFRVVEASSGEKGPFRLLASGPMRDGAPLELVVRDHRQQIATVVLEDWSSQLSTAISPTAGWGVPVNAIEFQRLGSRKDSEIQIWVTLAATSVGRGWECVGHRSGTYRNHISIRRNPPATGAMP
ncbi:hypothetical protein [Aeoliella straminimaris]|uniref:hypothetical protein n=1 Tax=Aeoliella straminimaris TaxID=2954799 RepID=UPI002093EDCF|nr:hypothetical protein [Aeoliella straminimaris]